MWRREVRLGSGNGGVVAVDGGGTGIRTLEGLAPLAVFKTAAFVRSAIPPGRESIEPRVRMIRSMDAPIQCDPLEESPHTPQDSILFT